MLTGMARRKKPSTLTKNKRLLQKCNSLFYNRNGLQLVRRASLARSGATVLIKTIFFFFDWLNDGLVEAATPLATAPRVVKAPNTKPRVNFFKRVAPFMSFGFIMTDFE